MISNIFTCTSSTASSWENDSIDILSIFSSFFLAFTFKNNFNKCLISLCFQACTSGLQKATCTLSWSFLCLSPLLTFSALLVWDVLSYGQLPGAGVVDEAKFTRVENCWFSFRGRRVSPKAVFLMATFSLQMSSVIHYSW